MADTLTANLSLVKVEVGASSDTWGDKLNANMDILDAAIAALQSVSSVAVGSIHFLPVSTVPDGYIKANGAAVSRTTYADLFAKYGTTFGSGDGSTTFNVIDLRGEFIRVWDDARGIDAARAVGSAQSDLVKAHTHTATAASNGAHTHTGTTTSNGAHTHTGTTASDGAHTHTGTTTSNGAHTHDVPSSAGTPGVGVQIGNIGGAPVATDSSGSHTHTFTTASNGAHTHTFTTASNGAHTHTFTTDSSGSHTHTITVDANVGAENRPRNVALMAVIKV